MTKYIFSLLLILTKLNLAFSQNSFNKDFIFQDNVYGISVIENSQDRFNYNVMLIKDPDTLFQFGLVDLDVSIFNKKFTTGLQKSIYAGKDTLNIQIGNIASNLFSNIVINRQIVNNSPIAGELYSKKQVQVFHTKYDSQVETSKKTIKKSFKNSKKAIKIKANQKIKDLRKTNKSKTGKKKIGRIKRNAIRSIKNGQIKEAKRKATEQRKAMYGKEEPSYQLEVDSVQVEVLEGNIKNITILGKNKKTDSTYYFYSWWPIAFSGLYDYGFSNQKAYSQKRRINTSRDYVKIDDLITYYPKLNLNGEDYSPRNGIYTIKSSKQKSIVLYKEEFKRILKSEIYTDFAGISGDNPNGLIQTEVRRKFVINHRKYQTAGMAYMGWLNYAEPQIILSKIEETNKFLATRLFDSKKSFQTIDLKNHQLFSLRLPINLVAFNYPYYKMATDINFGFGLNRVGVSDSVISNTLLEIKESNLSTSSFFIEVKHKFNSDSRYGLEFSIIPEYLSLISKDYQLIRSFEDNFNRKQRKMQLLIGFQLRGYINLTETSKAFLRIRSIHQSSGFGINLFQLQGGYSFDIFKVLKEKK